MNEPDGSRKVMGNAQMKKNFEDHACRLDALRNLLRGEKVSF